MDKILIEGNPVFFQNYKFFTDKSLSYLRKHLSVSNDKAVVYFDDINIPTEKVITLINKNMKNKVFIENNFADYFPYITKKLGDLPLHLISDLIFLSICSTYENITLVISVKDFDKISRELILRYNGKCSFLIYGQSNSLQKYSALKSDKKELTKEKFPKKTKLLFNDYLFLSLLLTVAMISGGLAGSFVPSQRLNNIATFLQNVHEENNSSFEVLQYNVVKAKSWVPSNYPAMADSILRFESDFALDEAKVFLYFESNVNISPINVDFIDAPNMSMQYDFLGVSSREYLGLTLIAQSTEDYLFTNEISIPQSYADFMISSRGFSPGNYGALIGEEINSNSQYEGIFSGQTLIVNSIFAENQTYLSYKNITGNVFFVGSLTNYYPSLPKIDIQVNDFSTENIRRIFNYIENYFAIEKDFFLSYALFSYTISLLENTGNSYEIGTANDKLASILLFYSSSYHIVYLLVFSISFILCNYLAITSISKMAKGNKRGLFLFLPLSCGFIVITISVSLIKYITIFASPIYINNFYSDTLILLNFLFLIFWTFLKISSARKIETSNSSFD